MAKPQHYDSVNRHSCPRCGVEVEGYSVDAAYVHTDAYTGKHAIIVGLDRKPDGLTTAKVERAANLDRYKLDPCGDEVTREELEALAPHVRPAND